MNRQNLRLALALFLFAVCNYDVAFGQSVIASLNTPGQGAGGGASPFFGQSVTTPDGLFNNLTFNFYENAVENNTFVQGNAYAQGSLYLLSEEYLGSPNQLSASTTGFLASTTTLSPEGNGFEWVFQSDITLEPSTQYFFYNNTTQTSSRGLSFSPGGNSYADGFRYFSSANGNYTNDFSADNHFELSGTSVPEPTACTAMLLLCTAICVRRRRRRQPAR